MGRGVKL